LADLKAGKANAATILQFPEQSRGSDPSRTTDASDELHAAEAPGSNDGAIDEGSTRSGTQAERLLAQLRRLRRKSMAREAQLDAEIIRDWDELERAAMRLAERPTVPLAFGPPASASLPSAQLDKLISAHLQERSQTAQKTRRLLLALAHAEQRANSLKNTITFRLGHALLNGFKSFRAARQLPGQLWSLRKETLKRRQRAAGSALRDDLGADEPAAAIDTVKVVEHYHFGGLPAVLLHLDGSRLGGKSQRAHGFMEAAKAIYAVDPTDGLELAKHANSFDPRPHRMKWIAFRSYDSGQVLEAMEWLRRTRADSRISFRASEIARAREIEGQHRLLTQGIAVPAAQRGYRPGNPDRILYLASSVLPFHNSGYTSRTQSLARALRDQNLDVRVVARPGYPHDRTDSLQKVTAQTYEIDGVPYELHGDDLPRDLPADEKLYRSADMLVRILEAHRPAVVHAASDYRNALPGLLAARRLGIPFVYEVRGLWEFTTATKHVNWEATERFDVARQLEGLTASQADAVLTLTPFLASELQLRGAEDGRLTIIPNCVDIDLFKPLPQDEEKRAELGLAQGDFVIGYAGSLVEYEGLDDLVLALNALRDKHRNLKLLIVGDGSARAMLQSLVRQHRLADRVIMPGRVKPEAVRRYIACFDVYAVPRRPERVCHLVSPLKPLEAMAMARPLIVSDVGGMVGMVEDGVTGFVHAAGDFRALAARIDDCISRPEEAARMARAARLFAERDRTWKAAAGRIVTVYDRLRAGKAAEA
jgi:glycosyltransferase involved in cell wall biosynthesis